MLDFFTRKVVFGFVASFFPLLSLMKINHTITFLIQYKNMFEKHFLKNFHYVAGKFALQWSKKFANHLKKKSVYWYQGKLQIKNV